MTRPRHLALALGAAVALAGCAASPRATRWADVVETTPAFLASTPAFDPSLATGGGDRVALTWVTRDSSGADVWIALSADSGATFSRPVRLDLHRGRVASYPESRPVAVFGGASRLAVAWASERDSGRFVDDLVVRASDDGGATFGAEVLLNDDHAVAGSGYHGFLTLDATPEGRMVAAWMDGRSRAAVAGAPEPDVAEIWSATSEDGGATWSANRRAVAAVCPCCRPQLRASGTRVALAYRSVRDGVRDPRLAVSSDGGVTFAFDTPVSADGWRLAGCPSTGPSLTLGRDGGWIAWFTGAAPTPGVRVRAWRDGRGADGVAIALDDSVRDAAHPLLAALGPLTLVAVVARDAGARHALAVRTLSAEGERSPWLLLGANARSGALATQDARHALAAWVEQTDAGPRVRVARLALRG